MKIALSGSFPILALMTSSSVAAAAKPLAKEVKSPAPISKPSEIPLIWAIPLNGLGKSGDEQRLFIAEFLRGFQQSDLYLKVCDAHKKMEDQAGGKVLTQQFAQTVNDFIFTLCEPKLTQGPDQHMADLGNMGAREEIFQINPDTYNTNATYKKVTTKLSDKNGICLYDDANRRAIKIIVFPASKAWVGWPPRMRIFYDDFKSKYSLTFSMNFEKTKMGAQHIIEADFDFYSNFTLLYEKFPETVSGFLLGTIGSPTMSPTMGYCILNPDNRGPKGSRMVEIKL